MRITRRRSLWVLIALLLGMGLAWWLMSSPSLSPASRGGIRSPHEVAELDVPSEVGRPSSPADGAAPARLMGKAPTRPSPDQRGPVTVRVLGPGGEPLRGVAVRLDGAASGTGTGIANERGVLTLDDVPYDGSTRLQFLGPAGVLHSRDGGEDMAPVLGPALTFVASMGLRLELDVVEAGTGRALHDVEADLVTKGASSPALRLGPRGFLAFPAVNQKGQVSFAVDAPRGRVAWEPLRHTVHVSPRAETLYFRYPLHLARQAVVVVETAEHTPSGAPLEAVHVAGRKVSKDGISGDAYGRHHIERLPHLPGELLKVYVNVSRDGYAARSATYVAISDDPLECLDVLVRLPPMKPGFMYRGGWHSTIGIGGGAGGSMRGRGGSRVIGPRGTLEVTVRRRDGKPAARVKVNLGGRTTRTDARGRAVFKAIPAGWHTVTTHQIGLLPMADLVQVKGGDETRVDLREPPGATVEVVVVDDAGTALPFATLEVKTGSGQPWVDLEDGRQRLDPFTDHEGRRVLRSLESGKVQLSVSWGARKKTLSIQLTPGETRPQKVVLPRPKVPGGR